MSGFRYVLMIGILALLTGLYLGNELEDTDAHNAGLEQSAPSPQQ